MHSEKIKMGNCKTKTEKLKVVNKNWRLNVRIEDGEAREMKTQKLT